MNTATDIKRLADDALALQNKDGMDAALREISQLCAYEIEFPGAAPATPGTEQPVAWTEGFGIDIHPNDEMDGGAQG